jgi:hypothetical protein
VFSKVIFKNSKNCEVNQTKRDTETGKQVQALRQPRKGSYARNIFLLWNSEEQNNRQDFNAAAIQGLKNRHFLVINNPQLFMLLKVEPRDMLPNRICLKCKSSLDCAYEFYVTCVEVDLALKIQLEAEDSENVSLFSKTPLCSSLIKISKLVKN